MPNWNEILTEVSGLIAAGAENALDVTRRRYLKNLAGMTGRNTIAYYSDFLGAPDVLNVAITDMDKNGFMSVINKLDRHKGLDLILHTPGGDIAATESLVDYLRSMFKTDIRAIIPQIAMSAGTMIACSCKAIIMGKQSSIGPIDPQIRGIPAFGVIEEFERAKKEIADDPACIPLWQTIIGKYHPTFIWECEQTIQWSQEIMEEWLKSNMLIKKKKQDRESTVLSIMRFLSNPQTTKDHARHIGMRDCINMGLVVHPLEELIEGKDLQDAVLSVHHAYMVTFSLSTIIKIIENQDGTSMMMSGG